MNPKFMKYDGCKTEEGGKPVERKMFDEGIECIKKQADLIDFEHVDQNSLDELADQVKKVVYKLAEIYGVQEMCKLIE